MQCYELVILYFRESATPRSRGLATPRSLATARPYGSEPYSRIDAKNKHFLFQGQLTSACARARGPASQQLRRPAPLQSTGSTPELLCNKLAPQ